MQPRWPGCDPSALAAPLRAEGPGAQAPEAACAELAARLGSELPEVRDRALLALGSKIQGGLLPLEAAAVAPGLPQRILHWINDRQAAAPPGAVQTALRILALLARVPQAAPAMHAAGCVRFLEDFKPHARAFGTEIEAVLQALLSHPLPSAPPACPPQAPRPGIVALAQPQCLAGAEERSAPAPPLGPALGGATLACGAPRSGWPAASGAGAPWAAGSVSVGAVEGMPLARGGAPVPSPAPSAWVAPAPALAPSEAALLQELASQLRLGDQAARLVACRALCGLAGRLPVLALLAHEPLVEGLCHAMRAAAESQGDSASTALVTVVASLGDLLSRLEAEVRPSAAGARGGPSGVPLTLRPLLAELLRSGLRHSATLPATQQALGPLLRLCAGSGGAQGAGDREFDPGHWSSLLLAGEDTADLAGDISTLVGCAVVRDPQMLVRLAASTKLCERWRAVLAQLVESARRSPPSPCTASSAAAHLSSLLELATSVRAHLELWPAGAPHESRWEHLESVSAFLRSTPVLALLVQSLEEPEPSALRRAASAALSALCGLRLWGLGPPKEPGAQQLEERLGELCCAGFLDSLGVEAPAAAALAAQCSLVNLLHSSPPAAAAAERAGFLGALAARVTALAGCLGHGPGPPRQAPAPALQQPQPPQEQLVWALRAFAALAASSPQASRSAACGEGCQAAPLAAVLLSVRAAAERDEAVCLEALELAGRCCAAGAACDGGNPAVALAARCEVVPWLMQLSQKAQASTAVFCRAMGVLALCGDALAGKPVLHRFVARLAEYLSSCWRAHSAQLKDEGRARRVVASLHFVASLRLCQRCVALLVSASPPAVASGEHGGPPAELCGVLGMDFWADLVDPGGRAPQQVRAAALRVLLAVAAAQVPQAKACFLGSPRTVQLLLKVARLGGRGPLPTLALNVLWVVAHSHQRALPLLRGLQAAEVVDEVAAALGGAAGRSPQRDAVDVAWAAGGLDHEDAGRLEGAAAEAEDLEYRALIVAQLQIILG